MTPVIACSTSAFRTPLREALETVAELGFTHVDLIAIPGWDHIQPAELADDFDAVASNVEELLAETGLEAAAMNCAVGALYDRTPETCAQRMRELEAIARLMGRLGIGVASFYPGYKVEDGRWNAVLADAAVTLREMAGVADKAGLTFALEAHFGTPFQTVSQVQTLFEAVPQARLAYDPSHFAMQGLDLRETEPLLGRTVHVHVRDAAPEKMQERFGKGTVDFEWLVSALQAIGYGGVYSVEYLPADAGALLDDIVQTRDCIARLTS